MSLLLIPFSTADKENQPSIQFRVGHKTTQHGGSIPLRISAWSEDKATMHLELISAGLHTPYTILLAPFLEQPYIPQIDLTPLGKNFVIKPSNGGGGEGVIMGASGISEILQARMEFPEQKVFNSGVYYTANHRRATAPGFVFFMRTAKRIHAGGIQTRIFTQMSQRRKKPGLV